MDEKTKERIKKGLDEAARRSNGKVRLAESSAIRFNREVFEEVQTLAGVRSLFSSDAVEFGWYFGPMWFGGLFEGLSAKIDEAYRAHLSEYFRFDVPGEVFAMKVADACRLITENRKRPETSPPVATTTAPRPLNVLLRILGILRVTRADGGVDGGVDGNRSERQAGGEHLGVDVSTADVRYLFDAYAQLRHYEVNVLPSLTSDDDLAYFKGEIALLKGVEGETFPLRLHMVGGETIDLSDMPGLILFVERRTGCRFTDVPKTP